MSAVATAADRRPPAIEHQKRWWLGVLALLTPLPLPFNDILGWSLLIGFWSAVAIYLREVETGRTVWLPNWAMNLLGLAYLPVFYIDFAVFFDGRLLPPLVHLALFVLTVKLFALKSNRDQWHAMLAVFFLFLASMGTSVHPTIVLYLLAFLVVSMLVMARFAGGHVQTLYGRQSAEPVRSRSFLFFGTLMTLVVAIPLFALLPRFDTPYFFNQASRGAAQSRSTGFSEQMSLDGIGRIRTSREVVLRMQYEGDDAPKRDIPLRLKGATYEIFRENSWHRGQLRSFPLARSASDLYRFVPDRPTRWAEIWMEPLGGQNLVLPTETVSVEIQGTGLRLDQAGVASLYGPPRSTVYMRVGLAEEPIGRYPEMRQSNHEPPTFLDTEGVTPRIAELADQVMGQGSRAQQVERLEEHLIGEYDYTLDLMGRSGEGVIESFLFEDRRGHCEYFATAMVLMLRSKGIPSRVVTGFYGAEYSRRQNYYIVRQSNAHAWVEVQLDRPGGDGPQWVTFDPTPPAGRPESISSWRTSLAQAWDAFVFRWDRYVLTYGLYDQMRAFERLRSAWQGLWSKRTPEQKPEAPGAEPPPPEDGKLALELGAEFGVILSLLAIAVALVVWWRRPRFTAARAYAALRRRVPSGDADEIAALPPLEVKDRLQTAYPEAADSAGRVIDLYVEEAFAGRPLDAAKTRELRQQHREAIKRLRRDRGRERFRRSA